MIKDLNSRTSRRSFLKAGAAGFGGIVAAQGLGAFADDRNPEKSEQTQLTTVNVLDFGAIPSLAEIDVKTWRHPDEVDNAPAIQRAIDSLPAYDEKTGLGGGVVFFPHARYMMARTITIPPGVVLRGEGFWSGGTQIYLPSAVWTDRDHPRAMFETRHPDGIDKPVPFVGLDNLEIVGYPRALDKGYQANVEEEARKTLNPGAILLIWRGGPGSFLRNVNLWGGFWGNQPPNNSARHALLIPPECHAGPSVFHGIDFDTCWQGVRMENAHDIVMFAPSWGCMNPYGQPWLSMKNCTGIVLHQAAAETGFRLRAENSQAVVFGGFGRSAVNGALAFGGDGPKFNEEEPPVFDLNNSDVSIYSFMLQNCKTAVRDVGSEGTFILPGPGGELGKEDLAVNLAFYPGRRAVIPGGGKGKARSFGG